MRDTSRDVPELSPHSTNTLEFAIEPCPSLNFRAIGSGQAAEQDIDSFQDLITIQSPGSSEQEALWFRTAVSGFAERNNIDTVGGLYPVMKVRGNVWHAMGYSTIRIKQGGLDGS